MGGGDLRNGGFFFFWIWSWGVVCGGLGVDGVDNLADKGDLSRI